MWSRRIDLLTTWKYYLGFLGFLAVTLIMRNITFSTVAWKNGSPVVYNSVYFYLQFITCIFVVMITGKMFGECFRASTSEYLRSLHISPLQIIVLRYIRLVVAILIPHSIVVVILFREVNSSIMSFLELYPQNAPFPIIDITVPLFQCAVAINFYIVLTLFLMLLFKDPMIPVILLMAYCALEAGPLNNILKEYSMFAGAFSAPNYYDYFPPNILWMIFTLPILFSIVLLFYGKHTFKLFNFSK